MPSWCPEPRTQRRRFKINRFDITGADGKLPAGGLSDYYINGLQVPAAGAKCMSGRSLNNAASCLAAHG